jgi:hypothetical protein
MANVAVRRMGNGMSGLYKLGVVLTGYAAALLLTYACFYLLRWIRPSQDSSGGMQAFGDLLLLIGLFGFLALIPTALALYFLRPFEKFWTFFSVASLALAATGPVAALMMGRPQQAPWAVLLVGFFGLLKVLGAPLFGIAFLICAVISPIRRSRWVLLGAALIEFAVSAYALFCLLFLRHWAL